MGRHCISIHIMVILTCLGLCLMPQHAGARELRLDLAAFVGQPEGRSDGVKLPFAWGLHRAKEDWVGWNTLWLRMKGPAGSNVHAVYNRIFCPIGEERVTKLSPPSGGKKARPCGPSQ